MTRHVEDFQEPHVDNGSLDQCLVTAFGIDEYGGTFDLAEYDEQRALGDDPGPVDAEAVCSSPKPAHAKVVDADALREAAQAVVDEAPLLGPHNLVCVVDPKKIDALRKALKGS